MLVTKTSAPRKRNGFGAVALDTQKVTQQRKSKIGKALQENDTCALVEAECTAALDSLLRLKASDLCSQSAISNIHIVVKDLDKIREEFEKIISAYKISIHNKLEEIAVGNIISLDRYFQVFYEIDGKKYSHSLSPYHELGHFGYGLAYPEADERFCGIIRKTSTQNYIEEALSIGDEYAAILLSYLGHLRINKEKIVESIDKEAYTSAYIRDIAPKLGCYKPYHDRIQNDAVIFNRHILQGMKKFIQAPNIGKVFETIYNKLYAPLYKELIPVLQGKSAQTEFIFNLSPRGLTSVKRKNP